ncbi:carbon-nitrogen hydrolase family protein [Cesiribacter andamanensis]|uniref:N-carbamoylputrescine amidase n=1 Tax=Cesiribacter andamanensis AMV16 TaxID=1279009 RepID=M7N0I4_9BACT|nr:carbon-nitrogen hydrolase family protein [Cesiribacter andamanensis]EMR00726.1 N-carbamoylputrescine amidase [Cesiribacter andamanensis AMV16]
MKITVAAAQYPITEHSSLDHWRTHIARWVADAARRGGQLLLFPEYASMEMVSIFEHPIRSDIRRQVLELQSVREAFCQTFEALAREWQLIIVAPSFPVLEEGNIHNRAYVFGPQGLAGYQDKFFMTRFEDEEWGISCGPKVLTLFEASWGSFGIQICYDVEFSMGSHLLGTAGASLILAPSCTETIRGATRVHIGARARALEAQAYSVVSQTIGDAPWSPAVDINWGFNAVYCTPDLHLPEEGILTRMPPQEPGWLLQELDFTHIEQVRTGGQVFNYKDHQRFHSRFSNNEEIQLQRKAI